MPRGETPAWMKPPRAIDVTIGAIGFAAAAASIWAWPATGGLLGAGLALVMLAIAVIDARYFIIPDELTIAALALAALNAALVDSPSPIEGIIDAVLRGALTMLFFWSVRRLYKRLRGREGLGLGDVKLAFVAGVWLDWIMIPVAVEIAAVAALAAYGVWRAMGKRPLNTKSRLPFGLFFAPAIWLTWFLSAIVAVF